MNQFEYVRNMYGKDVRRGSLVMTPKGEGRVTYADSRIRVRVNQDKHSTIFHPDDITIIKK